MTAILTTPPDLSPPVPERLSPEQRIALWADLMNACHSLLLGGLRREVGPTGDVEAAFRQWYRTRMEEHDRALRHLLEEFDRRENHHAG